MRLRVLLTLAAAGLAGGAFVGAGVASAAQPTVFARFEQDAKKKRPAAKGAQKPDKGKGGAPAVGKKIKLSPDGIKWGLTVDALSKLYSGVFDKEFIPLYKRVQPGVRMAELDHELAEKKALIKRNKLEFGTLPSGLDNTPIGGEYTYRNDESMTKLPLRSGAQRYFFFFSDRLWKIYDEQKLTKKSKLGKNYDQAVANLEKRFGKPPRKRPADPAAKRFFDEADWADGETILRLVDRDDLVGIVYIDQKIEENIDRYRTNKGGERGKLDGDVASVTSGESEDPNKDVGKAYKSKGKK
jgi:hypothetical protein